MPNIRESETAVEHKEWQQVVSIVTSVSMISVLGRRLYFFDMVPPNTVITHLGVSCQ